jgi:hypothetical protein
MLEVRLDPDPSIVSEGTAIESSVENAAAAIHHLSG